MMAMSASPARKASARCEGTVNDSSYLPASGPCVNPHTSGAVFKYCTIEMRSLVTNKFPEQIFQRGDSKSIADGNSACSAALCYKAFSLFGGSVNAETPALRVPALRARLFRPGAALDARCGRCVADCYHRCKNR